MTIEPKVVFDNGYEMTVEDLKEKYLDLTAAAAVLCNSFGYSYGGPDTLRDMSKKVQGSKYN
jgi:hypothetical protein